MEFFYWLDNLLDDLVEWLGTTFRSWIRSLVDKIKKVWKNEILPILNRTFGIVSELYVIFFKTYEGIVRMMTWEGEKQPVMFDLEKAPPNISIPTQDRIKDAPVHKLSFQ